MKISRSLRMLLLAFLVSVVSVTLTISPSSAADPNPAADEPDAATPLSLSQCGAGYLCMWSASNYTGSLQRFKTESQFSTIYLSRVGSFFNNRPDRFFIYQYSGGSTSACFAPRAKQNSTSGWLSSANTVYLSTVTSC